MLPTFVARRGRLGRVVGEDGIAIVPAAVETLRTNDVSHDFHQDPDFHYLTGFPEPDAVAVITPGHPDGEFTLFVRPRDPEMEAWNGYRAGTEGAVERYGADRAFVVSELEEVLTRLMLGREVIWYRTGNPGHDERISRILGKARSHRERFGETVPSTVRDVSVPLSEMRLVKGPEEIEALRRAGALSAEGHAEAMRFTAPGRHEYQVQAALEYFWRQAGSRHNGYPSIVASGPNACILHYVENQRRIEEGDLVLIDAGAEVEGYSADITRTFPASGRFTAPQRALYQVVHAAFRRGLELAAPGSSMRAIHEGAKRVLTEGMVDLGLLPRSVEDSLAMHHYLEFYFHGTGHWLGLDVHDPGAYRVDGEPRKLEPGMVFTVEPGLYVSADKEEVTLTLLQYDQDEWSRRRVLEGRAAAAAKEAEARENAERITHRVPVEFLGLGIRIEDDVAITDAGHENLTATLPTSAEEVEALCAESPRLPGAY